MPHTQTDLFSAIPPLPSGMTYAPDVLSTSEEDAIVAKIAALPFRPFEFQGYLGKRQVVHFGMRYDYNKREITSAAPIPDFLMQLRDRAAAYAGLPPSELRQVLVTEYQPGAGIGWHRDRPGFAEVIGISLLSGCKLRFRRPVEQGWERMAVMLAQRSIYLLTGPARTAWYHSISPVSALRYSITFRRRSESTGNERR